MDFVNGEVEINMDIYIEQGVGREVVGCYGIVNIFSVRVRGIWGLGWYLKESFMLVCEGFVFYIVRSFDFILKRRFKGKFRGIKYQKNKI